MVSTSRVFSVTGPRHWPCAHADLLQALVDVIAARTAPVRFYCISGNALDNVTPVTQALLLAAETAVNQPAPMDVPTSPPSLWNTLPLARSELNSDAGGTTAPRAQPKVSTSLRPLPYQQEAIVRNDGILGEPLLHDLLLEHSGLESDTLLRLRLLHFKTLLGSGGDFWQTFRKLTSVKQRPATLSVTQLKEVFEHRMNPLETLPETFDSFAHALNRHHTSSLPRHTMDTTEGQHFSRPFTNDEIEAVKDHIRAHCRGSARGLDDVGYDDVLDLPTDKLRILFQRCIDSCTAPSSWLTAIVAPVKKPRKDGTDPQSYRTIGLESCLLKTLTLLIDRRLRAWAEDTGRLLESQSGFRKGHRTNNNPFVLRAAIEKSRALDRSLWVVFLDLANAFPSVDQATLWTKLARWGVGGPLFDWLRHLYAHLQYTVRFDGAYSAVFRAVMGILIGDPASPTLWILYISDFEMRPHPDDVILSGTRVSHFELADDMTLVSLSHWGMQSKLSQFEDYCAVNFLLANISKTLACIHGPLPSPLPRLYLHGSPLQYVDTATLVGVTFTSTAHNIFARHNAQKADAAEKTANACYSLESYVGPLPPTVALTLYRARVDPHLTAACEIALDTQRSSMVDLERVQHTYLRRALHISTRSHLAPLFTETGIWPLRFRRLHLALRFLQYVLTEKPTLVYCALQELWSLTTTRGAPSWWGDLHSVAAALPVPIDIPLNTMPTIALTQDWITALRGSLAAHLYAKVTRSSRLTLLQRRIQWDSPGTPHKLSHLCAERAYISMRERAAREALTLLLFSEHPLAVERLRRDAVPVPRAWRICRFCQEPWAIEDEAHALLECPARQLTSLRDAFFAAAEPSHPGLKKLFFRLPRLAFLEVVLSSKSTLERWGTYVAAIFALCEETPCIRIACEGDLLALAAERAAPASGAS